ncbi:MAG: rhodanese-like domain-containing protein [Acidiferrobacterales bacterium]
MFGLSGNPIETIECSQAKQLVNDHGAQMVDVRTPQEFAQGAIPGSVNIPLQVINAAYQNLDKTKPVIVFCRSGARSAQAKSFLQQEGFDSVHNLGSIQKYLTC